MISSKPKVVIIVPTYNERENISRLIPILLDQTFPPLTEHYQLHILIVDDSSPDKTSEVAQKFASKSPQVHLLLNQKKSGLGGAYTKGMRYALDKLSADIVFEFDADLSHNPKKIKPMLEKLSQGYDVVLGSRYIKGGSIPADWGLHRKFLSIFGNKIIQFIITNFSIGRLVLEVLSGMWLKQCCPSSQKQNSQATPFKLVFCTRRCAKISKLLRSPCNLSIGIMENQS
jgi:dolichol-phosphate mannosyltransferase